MVRFVSGPVLAALLGLGGLAMAQDGLIVDPWQRVTSALGKPATTVPAGSDRTARRVGVASFPVERAKLGPSVVPLGPPLVADSKGMAVVPLGPATSSEVLDPWFTSAANVRAPFERSAAARGGHGDWAHEIDEIVDPWKKGPLAVVTDPIIVDPWAR